MSDLLICVDMGTTNTRVWLMRGDEIVATVRAGVGVRDTARDKSPRTLHAALRQSIAEVRSEADARGIVGSPRAVIAAGMITSPLGLCEVPHRVAPAGLDDLATGVARIELPEITDLPIYLVPGVRSGPDRSERDSIGEADVMRGEETLCLGLARLGLLSPESTLLNLGSHWKIVRLDRMMRIASSITSLSGELIHVTQSQTILASSVPQGRPEELDPDWVRAGIRAQRESGLARALFSVRLLEQRSESTAVERMAWLVGAYIAADFDAMLGRAILTAGSSVAIAGGNVLAAAWSKVLAENSIDARILDEAEIERGLLAGLRTIAASSII